MTSVTTTISTATSEVASGLIAVCAVKEQSTLPPLGVEDVYNNLHVALQNSQLQRSSSCPPGFVLLVPFETKMVDLLCAVCFWFFATKWLDVFTVTFFSF